MRELKALGGPAENYGVLADYVTFANRLNRYLVSSFLRRFQRLGESFRCAAGRVFFHLVMRFDNLGVEITAEQFNSFGRQPEKHIDTDAEIRCEHNRHRPRCLFDCSALLL